MYFPTAGKGAADPADAVSKGLLQLLTADVALCEQSMSAKRWIPAHCAHSEFLAILTRSGPDRSPE